MHVLSFDLEDWFHLLQWAPAESEESWNGFESRFERATDLILERLERHQATATFFCLGWIARRYPHVLRHIDACGHDFGSHGHAHRLLRDLPPPRFEADLSDSLHAIQDAIGRPVRAYRAPGFSLTPRTTWALEILLDHGVEVDSSVFTSRRAHGGWPGGPTAPGWLRWSGGRIRELPIVPAAWAGLRVPFNGGGYFRLLPYEVSRRLMRREPYVMTYFHPRDFDPEQPRMPRLGPVRRFRAYVGLGGAMRKLERLLEEFEFVNVSTALERVEWTEAPVLDVERPAVTVDVMPAADAAGAAAAGKAGAAGATDRAAGVGRER